MEGVSYLMAGRYQNAGYMFNEYEKRLPGNSDSIYFKGLAYEGMNDWTNAAREYSRYIRLVSSGRQVQYAHSRLAQWGWVQPGQLSFPHNHYQQPL